MGTNRGRTMVNAELLLFHSIEYTSQHTLPQQLYTQINHGMSNSYRFSKSCLSSPARPLRIHITVHPQPQTSLTTNQLTNPQSQDLIALVLGFLVAGGGITGYVRTGSIPSVVAGVSVGALVLPPEPTLLLPLAYSNSYLGNSTP
jgi:hypothetical protein